MAAASGASSELPGDLGLSADGGLQIAGLEWMGARAYDPVARGFLSVDPLAPALGAGWSGNPYAFAGNDPLHAVDPHGLAPVTDAELQEYADGLQGPLASAAGAVGDWWSDNWEYVAAGAAVVGGVALMATGVGGPAGLALMAGSGALLGGGISAGTQKFFNGTVDWKQVGVDTVVGGVTGVFGGGAAIAGKAAYSTKVASGQVTRALAVNAGVNGSVGGLSAGLTYVASPGETDLPGLLGAVTGGTVAGSIGGLAGPAGGTISRELGTHPAITSTAINATSGFGGSVVSDLVSGRPVSLSNAALAAGGSTITHQIGSGLGKIPAVDPLVNQHGVNYMTQMGSFHPRTVSGALDMTQRNSLALWGSSTSGAVIGGGVDYAQHLVGNGQ